LSRQLARQTRSLCRASRGPPGSVLPAPVPPGERAMEYQLYPTHWVRAQLHSSQQERPPLPR